MFASDYRFLARDSLKNNWGNAVLVNIVAMLLSGGAVALIAPIIQVYSLVRYGLTSVGSVSYLDYIYNFIYNSGPFLGLLIFLIGAAITLISGAIQLGLCQFNMHLVMRYPQKPFQTLFERFNIIFKAFLLNLVMSIFIALWSLLLIIPGIIAAYRYSFATYIMAQNPDIGVMEAIRKSKELTNGRKWRLFCLQISFFGWSILSYFTMGLGNLWLTPYISASTAAFYLDAAGQLPYRRDEMGNVPGSQTQEPQNNSDTGEQ